MMSTRILANLTCLQIANIDLWSLDDETNFTVSVNTYRADEPENIYQERSDTYWLDWYE